jgi:hypothetical protein
MKHSGSPPSANDLTWFFFFYSFMMAIDIMLLIGFTFHCFLPYKNFVSFGWAFMFLIAGVPYLSPILAYLSMLKGSPSLMRTSTNLNNSVILFNIPFTIGLLILNDDDVLYIRMLVLMVLVKSILSWVTAVIRQYLTNPRYTRN